MHCRISPNRTRNPSGFIMKISSRDHSLLIYEENRTKIDGMGTFQGRHHSVKKGQDKYNIYLYNHCTEVITASSRQNLYFFNLCICPQPYDLSKYFHRNE